jgi:hypothetical protein
MILTSGCSDVPGNKYALRPHNHAFRVLMSCDSSEITMRQFLNLSCYGMAFRIIQNFQAACFEFYFILNLNLCFLYLEMFHILIVGIHEVHIICLPIYVFIYMFSYVFIYIFIHRAVYLSTDNTRSSNIKHASRLNGGRMCVCLAAESFAKDMCPWRHKH